MRPVPAGLGVEPAADADRLLSEPPEELPAVLHLAHALGQHLAHLQGHQRGKVLGALGDLLEDRAQDLATLAGRGRRPLRLHPAGRIERGDRVVRRGVGNGGQDLVVGRVEHVER